MGVRLCVCDRSPPNSVTAGLVHSVGREILDHYETKGKVFSPRRRNSWTRSSSVICFPLPSTMVTFGFPSKIKKQACAKAVGRSLHVSMVSGPGAGMLPCVTEYGIFPLIFLEREADRIRSAYAKRHSDHNSMNSTASSVFELLRRQYSPVADSTICDLESYPHRLRRFRHCP
jgi:hypothetical protein